MCPTTTYFSGRRRGGEGFRIWAPLNVCHNVQEIFRATPPLLATNGATGDDDDKGKKTFSGIHSTSFRYVCFLLSRE
jgi:hypothetical protein